MIHVGPEPQNPFRPGAGHMPPYLAGRERENEEFARLLQQDVILANTVLTGLRGVGKTVLLDTFKPLAISKGWAWVGTDLSESTSISEERLALRLMTDLAVLTSSVRVTAESVPKIGFSPDKKLAQQTLNFPFLEGLYARTPGLVSDKLKAVLEFVWHLLQGMGKRGMIFAYDEAQNLADHRARNEYPLSLMLDVFQSIQRKGVPFMLVLVGLPTLFPKLVEARTFAERMFRVIFLDRLGENDSRDAILKPLQASGYELRWEESIIRLIIEVSGGYPYFIQFICREVYDAEIQSIGMDQQLVVPIDGITRKLDTDFFSGRWARATDRQRELLTVVASLPDSDGEFTVQEVVEKSLELLRKPFSPSHVSQMFSTLSDIGLIYKNRHGKYSFAVPLLGRFILRQSGGK